MAQKIRNFSERLCLERKKHGLSQGEFAKKLGLSGHAQVSRYESGKSLPDTVALEKIAKIFNVDLHWLITDELSPTVKMIIDRIRPYALAHLSDITIELQKLERERRDLYARNAQGESLGGAIKDVEALIEKQHLYYKRAFQDIDEVLDIATHREDGEVIRNPQEKARFDKAIKSFEVLRPPCEKI